MKVPPCALRRGGEGARESRQTDRWTERERWGKEKEIENEGERRGERDGGESEIIHTLYIQTELSSFV